METSNLWTLAFPKLSTWDHGSLAALPLLNRASRSLNVTWEASVVHKATESATLERYDGAGMITSKRRLYGSLQSTLGYLTAGSSGYLDVKHRQLRRKMWSKCIRIRKSGISIRKDTTSVKTSGLSFIPGQVQQDNCVKATQSSDDPSIETDVLKEDFQ